MPLNDTAQNQGFDSDTTIRSCPEGVCPGVEIESLDVLPDVSPTNKENPDRTKDGSGVPLWIDLGQGLRGWDDSKDQYYPFRPSCEDHSPWASDWSENLDYKLPLPFKMPPCDFVGKKEIKAFVIHFHGEGQESGGDRYFDTINDALETYGLDVDHVAVYAPSAPWRYHPAYSFPETKEIWYSNLWYSYVEEKFHEENLKFSGC